MKFNKVKKFLATVLSLAMILSSVPAAGMSTVKAAETGTLTEVKSVTADDNVVTITFNDGIKGKLTLLEDGIFRYNVDPSGKFSEYAAPRAGDNDPNKVVARIPQYPDSSDNYSKPEAVVTQDGENWVISSGDTKIIFDADAKMTIKSGEKVVMKELTSLSVDKSTVQTLEEHQGEQFFGGGTQNGRFIHTGKQINIANESSWSDGGVASPSPFYYSTEGYGVLRNTFQSGKYDFGAASDGVVTAAHNEKEFDAYYFVSGADSKAEAAQELLQGYFHVTGNPALLPQYAFYVGHLNAYNRDMWTEGSGKWEVKGNGPYNEAGTKTGEAGGTGTTFKPNTHAESLNGHGPEILGDNIPEGVDFPWQFSAQARVKQYLDYDMPFGFFLPNDGYGCGYGTNGYQMTDDKSADRLKAVEANLKNLAEFAKYAKDHGVETGLWTQSNLTPDAAKANEQWQLLRSFQGEVQAGVTTLKTDVAWVGNGYDFQLNAVKQAYDIMTTEKLTGDRNNTRPNIISLDGWAGSQRFNSVWTGDQTGGSWEYIRFHIPTFIGQSLSGNPNIGCDMDGIWGGNRVIATRDYQWKSFAPQMLDMDGWGSFQKAPYTHGDPYTGVSRMYLKLKAMMMSYTYTNAYAAANIDTKNGDQGLPMVRAMFLEYPNAAESYGELAKYQYMWGGNLLVAPLYQNTKADDLGNDVRDGIYLPGGETWIDYFTGEQYRGGQVLNGFNAPIWKIPLFVKNGAIIPMYAEHNVATPGVEKGIDKSQRLVEFWPEGNTEFNTIEDDGAFVKNELEKVDGYGTVDHVSYGDHVETLYTSKVDGTTATLTANKSTGTYEGYEKDKDTTFIVHASKAPDKLTATNGTAALTEVKVDSKEAFDAAKAAEGTFVSFYDAAPAIETFASEEEVLIADLVKDVKVAGKLYVKFANTDSKANEQKLVIEGFENEGNLPKDEVDENLTAPVLRANEDEATPTSITVEWDAVDGADFYEIEADGSPIMYTVAGGATTFTHVGLEFKSEHTYRIRSANANGHSEWSDALTAVSADDPFINTPTPVSVTWDGGYYSGNIKNAFNHIFEGGDTGFHSSAGVADKWVTVDYGNAYLLDNVEYYHRNGGNGVVKKMHVETSLDGVHWVGQDFTLSNNGILDVMDLKDPTTGQDFIGARYIRFQATQSVGNFFHISEMKVNTIKAKTSGNAAKPFKVGNIYTIEMAEPTEASFASIYKKESSAHASVKNPAWVGEVQKLYADINFNGYSDIYDYAFTAFQADGGTKKTDSVRGFVKLVPSATELKAGDTVTIAVTAENVKNMNAYGTIMHYDQTQLQYVGHEYTALLGGEDGMYTKGMTGNIVYDDEAYVNHNAINMGDKDLVNADGVLSTITMKALKDVTLTEDVIDLSTVTIMGPRYDFIDCVNNGSEPEEQVVKFGQNDFNLTLTNDVLPEDDGTNVTKIIQQNNYNGLFNGSFGREWEFKWNPTPEQTQLTFPTTLHMDLKEDTFFVDQVKVYNANKGNGYLTNVKAQLVYTDGTTSDEIILDKDPGANNAFVFDFTPEKAVDRIDVTFLKTTNPQMLTLAEIEVTGREIKTQDVVFGQNDFNLTLTNDVLPEDDGTNVTKIIQQNNYNGLFNGSFGREWEFKWNPTPEQTQLTFPTTLHMDLKEDTFFVDQVKVYNANKGNGYLTNVKAQLVYTDGTASAEIILDKDPGANNAFVFDFTPEKAVDRIDVTFLKTTNPQMLTLAEIEVTGHTYVLPEPKPVDKSTLKAAIEAAEKLVEEDYTAASWKEFKTALSLAKLINDKADADQTNVDKIANALFDAMDALVKVVVKDDLNAAIAEAKLLNEADYTAPTWKDLADALAKAEEVAADAEATQDQVNSALGLLQTAVNNLEVKVVLYDVTVVDGTMIDGTTEGQFEYNTKVIVKAAAEKEGKKFAGWKVGDTMISTNSEYAFFVGSDITLTAVYEKAEIKAAALLQSIDVTKREDGKSDIRYLAQLVLPAGAKLVDAGLVWTNKAATVTDTQLVLENVGSDTVVGVKATHISKISTTLQYSVTIKGVPTKVSVPGKVFATYTLNGKTETVYSEVGTGTAK